MLLAEYFAKSSYDYEAASARLEALMEDEGLPYDRGERSYNSRLAQELAAWAVEEHGAEGIHQRLFQAYFVERQNISEPAVLEAVADAVGLDRAEAASVLAEGKYRERVDQDWQLSRRLGVTGVPTVAIEGQGVVGAQPYETLEALAIQLGIPKRAS